MDPKPETATSPSRALNNYMVDFDRVNVGQNVDI